MADMKPPERGGKPKKIEASGPPGGPYTPGARRGAPMPSERERRVKGAMDVKGGLSQLLEQADAPEEVIEAAEQVESMPGGMELLYTMAAEELMQKAGASKSDAKKVRLYNMGGAVSKKGSADSAVVRGGGPQFQDSDYEVDTYAKGGAARAAARKTRAAGRGDDSMMLHMSPEEYEVITSMWGEPEINPNTGIGEYGFLSKVWKKVKGAVKKIFKSKIFQIVAPIALSIFAPGLGTAIGSALGAGATAAPIIGNALIQGGLSAAGGGDFVKGALSGAITGGLGKVAGSQVQKFANVSDKTAGVIGSSLAGGAASSITGGDFVEGALSGAVGEMMRPTMEGLAKSGQDVLGLETVEGQILAGRAPDPDVVASDLMASQIASGEAYYDPNTGAYVTGEGLGDLALEQGRLPGQTDVSPQVTVTPPAAAPAPAAGGDDFMQYALPALTAMGALGGGEYQEGAPPELPPHMLESLPVYTSNRQFIGPTDPSAYYTYGRQGAPQSGESLFITPDPFAGETGTPTARPGGLGQATDPIAQMIAQGQPVPQGMVRGGGGRLQQAGYTYDQNSRTWMPPMQELGQGVPGFQRGGEFDYWEQNADVPAAAPEVSAQGRYVKGQGTGRSDDIPARLSDGEYVIDAETVALLGDGSGDAGAQRLDEMRRNLRKHKAKNLKKGEFTHKAKAPNQYMGRLRAAAGRA